MDAAGPPPIYFGFGRSHDFSHIPLGEHVKVVDEIGQAAIFPLCRAVVHHGGAGTTAAGLRAGIPALILFAVWLDQPIWATAVKRLGGGSAHSFSAVTQDSLVAELRSIFTPQYLIRAREIAAQMTKPAESAASAADLLEETARRGRLTLKAR